jgi:cytochrome P450
MSTRRGFEEILKPENRELPDRGWAELRAEPVRREDDGRWVVSGYDEVRQLLSDPRISVAPKAADVAKYDSEAPQRALAMVALDSPAHEQVRRHFMRSFGPPWHPHRVADLETTVRRWTADLLDAAAQRTQMDVVEDFAYPVPVWAICSLLGVPPDDDERFTQWLNPILEAHSSTQMTQALAHADSQMSDYFRELMIRRRNDPRDDMITGVATDDSDSRAPGEELILENIFVLFLGGHQTTVHAVGSSILTLLRHPDVLGRVRHDPTIVPAVFEEVLRLEPPAQLFDDRHALADIPVGDMVIPQGSPVTLVLAAANRDPKRFPHPDTFDIDRTDNEHLSFLGGPHYCLGAPLARLEGRIMITEWARRVENPRLVIDPPPYEPNPRLRGPRHLLVGYDRILT